MPMLLTEKREANKRIFVKKRMETLYATMRNRMALTHSTQIVALKNQNAQFEQFRISYHKALNEYQITNSLGNGCSFVLGKTYISMYINVRFYDVKYQFLLNDERHLPYFLYDLLDQFENIERDYLKLMEEFNKLEEIANSIRNWVNEHFLNTNYNFRLTENENKILLSISLHGRVLSIPIYYRRYKQILPHIMTTLKLYENIIATTKIKVLISF
jgi:hypothetical protein